jgi:hypothetical protein
MNLKNIMDLRKIFLKRGSAVISIKLALKILRFKRETEAEAEFYRERYTRILNDCARIGEDGKFVFDDDGCILLKPERAEDFRSQMQELEEAESDVSIEFAEEELSEMKLTLEEMETAWKYMKKEEEQHD